jgi:hypothetical protein
LADLRFKCSYCGRQNRIIHSSLTFRQHRILKAIGDLERDLGKPAPTNAIAVKIGMGVTVTKEDLSHLEQMKEICRPNGKKSGWSIKSPEELIAVPA